jgi:hypothetical protein
MTRSPCFSQPTTPTVPDRLRACLGPGCDDHGDVTERGDPVSPNPITARMEQLAQSIAERVVTLVIDAIDIDALIDRVDVEKIIERVDVDKVVARVDVDKVVARVDVEKIIERVDVNAIVNKLDIDSLVEQTELGSIIARSTTGVLTEILDVIRSQGVGLDDFFLRWSNRPIGRKVVNLPPGPPLLVEAVTT